MAISLPSNVTAFLTQVKNDLTKGPALDGPNSPTLFGPGRNFCSAQDIANVLRLLASATGNTGLLANEISAIMSGKDPSKAQYVGQLGGDNRLIIDAFKKLIEYTGGTFPAGPVLFSSTVVGAVLSGARKFSVNLRGGKVRIDEFRGFVVVVDGVRHVVVSNTDDGVITVDRDLAALSGGEAVLVRDDIDFLKNTCHPVVGAGGHSGGDNAILASLITAAQTAVEGFTVTTMTLGAVSGSAEVGGAGATFTVVFAGTAPSGNIVVPIASSEPDKATVSASSLTFTSGNYTTPQVVTVTGVAVDAGVEITVGPTVGQDARFTGFSGTRTVIVVDNA